MYPLLQQTELTKLNQALYVVKMADLKNICHKLSLPAEGKKMELINRITTFINTGEILHTPKIPPISRSENYPPQPMRAKYLILYGDYKNDLLHRIFFQQFIGEHFHFTAYGIDWLNERWLSGKPPTYKEFANYWIEETERRKNNPVPPKAEWALINFMQQKRSEDPSLSQKILMSLWKDKREEETKIAMNIIKSITDKKKSDNYED